MIRSACCRIKLFDMVCIRISHCLRDILTAGLNMAPLMSANIATLTSSENPNASDMYRSFAGDGGKGWSMGWSAFGGVESAAICVPAKAKNKNMKVPMNSPRKTGDSFLRDWSDHVNFLSLSDMVEVPDSKASSLSCLRSFMVTNKNCTLRRL